MRVVTWNVLGACVGRTARDGIAERLRALDADVVALQEARRPLTRRLARLAGYERRVFAAKRLECRPPSRQEGLATLSRLHVLESSWHDLRAGRRVAVAVTVEAEGVALRVLNAHLDTEVGSRATNVRALLAVAAGEPSTTTPTIVVGDLNTKVRPPGHDDRAYDELLAGGFADAFAAASPASADVQRCPGDVGREPGPDEVARCGYTNWHDARDPIQRRGSPRHRLDYVLVGSGVAVDAVWSPKPGDDDFDAFRDLSDHLPVIADLRLA